MNGCSVENSGGVFWENPWGNFVIQMEVEIFLTYYKESPIFYFLENPGGILKVWGVFYFLYTLGKLAKRGGGWLPSGATKGG